MSLLLPEKTILVTNSSTMLPSRLAKYTGRPTKFLALHFANSIWKNNTAEVMKHETTENKYSPWLKKWVDQKVKGKIYNRKYTDKKTGNY